MDLAGYAFGTKDFAKLDKSLLSIKIKYSACSSWKDLLHTISQNQKQLSSLSICRTNLKDEAIEPILNLKELKSLCLGKFWNKKDSNSITIEGVKIIGKMNQLEGLSLGNDKYFQKNVIPVEAVEVICEHLTNLKSLQLSLELNYLDRRRISDIGARMIGQSLKRLEKLELKENQITSEGLESLLNGLPYLEKLNVCKCQVIQKVTKLHKAH